MDDALIQTKHRFAEELVHDRKGDIEPLLADQWVIISLLQKSIRRGEAETAQRAAFTLFAQKGYAIWRRFMVIAFEDVGAASPDAVAMTVAASTDPGWRKASGGDLHIAVQLARVLAEAPKSRSAEHLITSAQHHPSLAKSRMLRAAASLTDHLDTVMDQNASLTERALAVWCASGIGWKVEKRAKGDLPALLETFRSHGVPDEFVTATGIAAQKTREPITLMVPLVWLAANRLSRPTMTKSELPVTKIVDDVPLYSLDKHTRLGREAIRRFASENEEVRGTLARYVPAARRHDAAYMAAFYADAAPLAIRLNWKGADALETLGTETDLLLSGVPPEGFAPLLATLRNNLGRVPVDEYTIEHILPQNENLSGAWKSAYELAPIVQCAGPAPCQRRSVWRSYERTATFCPLSDNSGHRRGLASGWLVRL
jgi:MgsA AAA+ ATPase C terminal